MHPFHINHLALLVSTVAQWMLGAVWYGVIFKKSWTALTGVTMGDNKNSAIVGMVTSFVGSMILSFVLVHVILWSARTGFVLGAAIGILCWLGFIVPPLFSQYIYERKPGGLFAITAGYWLVGMALSGGILAAWQ
jgi:hypothetical protein